MSEEQKQNTNTSDYDVINPIETRQTLTGEAQQRLLQQQQFEQPIQQHPYQQQYQEQFYEPDSEIIQREQPNKVEKFDPEELVQRSRTEQQQIQNPSDVRVIERERREVQVPGGLRKEVHGFVEPKETKIHFVEQRPGEVIYIKQQPSYFYQAQFYPGMRRPTNQPVRDPTIEFFNSLVAKNTHCLLGRTGLKVSRICLGTMNFGRIDPQLGDRPGQLNEVDAHRILDRYLELGGNCIDTADFFPWFGTCGESERIIGSWLDKQTRDRVFIVTKVRMPVDPNNINSGGLSRAHIIDTVKKSLERLRTNYIDLLMINGWDPTVSINETIRHLNDLVTTGLVRYIGVCDLKGWQLQKFIDASRMLNMHKCVCYEGEYNLLTRGLEWEVVDVCRNERIGFFAYSPFKYGFLTDQYTPESSEPVEGTRIESASQTPNLVSMAEPFEEMRSNPIYENLLGVCERIGRQRSLTTSQIAILWALQKGFVTSCVVGVSSVQELEENMNCLSGDIVLSQKELLELDQASRIRLQYPYTMSLSNVAGYKEINPSNLNSFEQLSVSNEYVPFEQVDMMRLGARDTLHESTTLGFPERQPFGEPSITGQGLKWQPQAQQQQQETPLQKQQKIGLFHAQEQDLQGQKDRQQQQPVEAQVKAQHTQYSPTEEEQTRS